jgi:outer membrane protein assembly factor BamB
VQAKADDGQNWPGYRGTDRMGIAPPGNEAVPLQWSDTENICWKLALPGRGASSPIVWRDNVYVTAYTGYGLEKNDPHRNMPKLKRHLFCVDRLTGKVRWKVEEGMKDPRHGDHSQSDFLALHGYASSTPVADENGVYVYFGRGGVIAFDHTGRERWRAALGSKEHNWGSASSPILFENLLIVHADLESEAMIAFDKQTGREVWRVPTGSGDSWSTPLIVQAAGRQELVFHHSAADYRDPSSIGKIAAVNPRDGNPLWECKLLKNYLCPSPVAENGVIYWLAYQKGAAVRAGGSGDVTDSHVLWTTTRGTETCTPIIWEGHVYWVNEESGVTHCLDAKTGAVVYQERLEPASGKMYASGVLVGDRIYYVSRKNGTYVVEAKPKFRLLAHNQITSDTSVFNATPAVSRGQMFLRSDGYLYCIGKN